jgi:hypothetical protein
MQGGFGVGMGVGMQGFSNGLNVPSLEKMNMPLNERAKYIINSVNYLLNKHQIGKFLEEETLLKILHNSFFYLFFLLNLFSVLFVNSNCYLHRKYDDTSRLYCNVQNK